MLDFEGPIQGQALRVAAKSAAILDRHSTRWRSRTAVGAEEWLRRGQTKEWAQKQVSCQDFVITIREGRHQFYWHKKQEQSRISPSDTVVMLTIVHSLRSRPIVRRGVRYCVARAKTRRAPTRRDRPRPRWARRASPRQKPASRVLHPVRSAALLILAAAARRQGPHCSRGSWRRPRRLSPLTARFAAAPPRASRSDVPRQVDIKRYKRMDQAHELEAQAGTKRSAAAATAKKAQD